MKQLSIILKLVLCTLLASCATSSSPPVTYYHLYANAEALTKFETKATYHLAPVRIPEVIKRQPIVSHGSKRNTLNISNTNLWASDLRETVYETLLILLRHQLPHAQINSVAVPTNIESDYKVSIQIQEFIGQLNGECTLHAVWQVVGQSGDSIIIRETVLSKNIPDESYSSYVSVLNQLLSEFSQVVAKELNTIR